MRNKVVQRGSWRSFALFLSLSGCTALSDCKYETGQKIRTSQAWHEFDGCNEQCFTCDYRDGWKKGYYDVLTGGDGRPPVVPPKKYWKPPVFTEHDPSRQNDWFIGYQDGAACAKTQPDYHYVPTFMAPNMYHGSEGHEIVEVISSESEIPAEPTAPPTMGEVPASEVEPAPMSNAAENPPANPAENPAATPDSAPDAPKPNAEEYEKDPAPTSTGTQKTVPNATRKLVDGYRRQSGTYLDQLVQNASHSTEHEQVTAE